MKNHDPVHKYDAPAPHEVNSRTLDNSKKNNNNQSTSSLPGIGRHNRGSAVDVGNDLNNIDELI